MARTRALCALLVVCLAAGAAAFTNPDQLQILENFRDAMLARPEHGNWAKALATWTCPTNPGNSDASCDPCGRETWGNWDHMGCRGARVSHDKYQVPGTGQSTNIHITDYSIEGPVPLAELCPLKSLREFDVDGGHLTGTIPAGFAQCFPDLIEIDLSFNQLTGTVPPEIAAVQDLEQFKVEENKLSGTIPSQFGSMPAISWLRFAGNKMGGALPASLASTAARLYQLTLDTNDFSGSLYMLANHRFSSFNAAENPKLCGMVPVGVRYAHGYNPYQTQLGLPCPEELAGAWTDLSETLP